MTEPKQDTRKQIVVRMEQDEIKNLKQFCLDNGLTITESIKIGLALLKCSNEPLHAKDDNTNYTLIFDKQKFLSLAGVEPSKIEKVIF